MSKAAAKMLDLRVCGLVVMIGRCQRLDPGSIPGRRTNGKFFVCLFVFILSFLFFLFFLFGCCFFVLWFVVFRRRFVVVCCRRLSAAQLHSGVCVCVVSPSVGGLHNSVGRVTAS